MMLEEIRLRRLAGQHLCAPSDTQTVVKDLCGVQAQFLSHALHGLSIRCGKVDTDNLVKSWTLRGTMHLFSADDLPLFLHEGRSHFLRPVDTLDGDAYITKDRKAYFAEVIVAAIGEGIGEREALKRVCQQAGMTEAEGKSLFDPWGGTIRALCEQGRIYHRVQETKAFQLCPPFTPMPEQAARIELARRYFTNFGPATVRDAAYFFGKPQSQVKQWLNSLPVSETEVDGTACFFIENGREPIGSLPECLFLAGFDQLLLGYEKTESPFLPPEAIRPIFAPGGIVRPAVLLHGQAVGWWSRKNRKLTVTLFASADQAVISDAALKQWRDLKQIIFVS